MSTKRTAVKGNTTAQGSTNGTSRNMTAVELPKYLTTREFLTPLCIWEAEDPKDGLRWSFYQDEKAKTFTNHCPGCRGSYESLLIPVQFCPWCGAELDPDTAEPFGTATL